MKLTSIFAGLLALVILGILYKRMIDREIPEPISKAQALVPAVLGAVSLPIAVKTAVALVQTIQNTGFQLNDQSLLFQSMVPALVTAALPEEFFKLIMILITLVIFRKKVDNVYEYILIGAAVGLGFSVWEDFVYGEELIAVAVRLPMIAGHMAMNMVMAEYLGRARFNKLNGKGPRALYCVLAFVIPVLIHTFYDGSTTGNKFLFNSIATDDRLNTIVGGCLAAVAVIGMIAFQIVIITRSKKKAAELSAMKVLPEAE